MEERFCRYMPGRAFHLISWLAGLAGLALIVWHFQLSGFAAQIAKVGIAGGLAWVVLTLSARLLLIEVTVLPIRRLGFELRRSDAFWIGWVRTFANQVIPLSGLAIFTREVRRRSHLPWSELVALSTPMFLFAAAALSAIGSVAVALGSSYLGASAIPMLAAFVVVGAGSIFAATHAAWMMDRLPGATLLFASQSAAAFRRLLESRGLVTKILAVHVLAIVLRGARLWLLFVIAGAEMSLSGALLLAVIAESAALFQITPGGLGLREGAIIGGSALLGISPDLGALVALVDRLFLVAMTTFLAILGYWLLRR